MVNETLQDIFDEFYMREARRKEKHQIEELEEQLDILTEENHALEDDLYDAHAEADDWEEEYRNMKHKYDQLKEKIKTIISE